MAHVYIEIEMVDFAVVITVVSYDVHQRLPVPFWLVIGIPLLNVYHSQDIG